jgi:hypothetical protein
MARENKVIKVFRFLVDGYGAGVQYDPDLPRDEVPDLIVTLKVDDEEMRLSSKGPQFKLFCVELAREELGEAFTLADMNALNLQLETVISRNEAVRKSGSCCACAEDTFEMDDE